MFPRYSHPARFAMAAAAAADVFLVRGVHIDVTADTAAEARKQALARAERQAFERLIERLTLAVDREFLPVVKASEIATLVSDFEVTDRKSSAVRWIGELTYRFKRDAVTQFLNEHGVAFAETPSKPVMVLALFEQAGALMLWGDPNPWRDAWRRLGARDGLLPLVLAQGQFADVADVSPEQAMRGDAGAISKVAARYGARASVVARATLHIDAIRGDAAVAVRLSAFEGAGQPLTDVLEFKGLGGEETPALLLRAARGVTEVLEDGWKRVNLIEGSGDTAIMVGVAISGLEDWLEFRRRLQSVNLVKRVEVLLLSLNAARINLHFSGGSAQLVSALSQKDLALSRSDGTWTLAYAKPGSGG